MRSLVAYRNARKLTQSALARALGVSQAYVSQVEAGTRPISRKLAARLARLPDLPPGIVPPGHADLDAANADFAADLSALGYPGFADRAAAPTLDFEAGDTKAGDAKTKSSGARETRRASTLAPTPLPRNPAAVIVAILSRRQVAPSVMAAIPWVLVTHADLDAPWLVDQARRRNLQNRLGFLTDLALDVARARDARHGPRPSPDDSPDRDGNRTSISRADSSDRDEPDIVARLESLRADLETSRLANVDTLARELTAAERQFFEEHRGAAARHWNLLTGLTIAQLPYK